MSFMLLAPDGLPLLLSVLAAGYPEAHHKVTISLSAGVVHPATGSIAKDEKARRVSKIGPVKGWYLDLTGSSLQVKLAGLSGPPMQCIPLPGLAQAWVFHCLRG